MKEVRSTWRTLLAHPLLWLVFVCQLITQLVVPKGHQQLYYTAHLLFSQTLGTTADVLGVLHSGFTAELGNFDFNNPGLFLVHWWFCAPSKHSLGHRVQLLLISSEERIKRTQAVL